MIRHIRHCLRRPLLIAGVLMCLSLPLGAKEPLDPVIGRADQDSRNPIVSLFAGKRLDLWSFKLIVRPELPLADEKSAKSPIDNLVQKYLASQGLNLLPQARRSVLIRRLAFTLTGLPPTPEEIDRLVADTRSDEQVLNDWCDELLSRPSYGEHFAAYWLDLVRYSDSTGYDWDEWRKESWRYRDYVVRSLNTDKPYDQFVREQLAGDELVPEVPTTLAEQEALLATGFLRVGPWDNSSKLFGEGEKARFQWMSDLVETTGSAFLGLTMSCCRCHDHKFDPVSQQDYYRLKAVFEPLEFRDSQPIDLADQQADIRENHRSLEEKIEPLQKERQALIDKGLAAAKSAKTNKEGKDKEERARRQLSKEEQGRLDALDQQIAEFRKAKKAFTTALLAGETAADANRKTYVLGSGDLSQVREEVTAGVLCFFEPQGFKPSPRKASSGRRQALADWITHESNPLTTRVLAARLWQFAMGTPLVPTPDDFGFAGQRPVDPQLLDWLASDVSRQGWSLKKMLRRIVSSQTWRQQVSSGDRPLSPTLRRLSAEQMRDALLAVSGQLMPKQGGPSVWPELPEDVLQANPAFLDDNAEKTKGWYPSPAGEQAVRSLYLIRKRSVKVPFLETFDLPENFQSCACRKVSTVAPQALTLLNSQLISEAAKNLAQRLTKEVGDDQEAQLLRAWRLALGRPARADEQSLLLPLWKERGAIEGCRLLLNLNEFAYLD